MFRKQLFYLTSDQLWAYQWEGGQLSEGVAFGADRAGIDAFMDYVHAQGKHPIYLLADLIEEDFQRQQMPHVPGRAGRQLVARRLAQQFRETPYRHVSVQGRESEGRRDDIVLLCGLNNPSILTPWIEALESLKAPLAGLYSTALLGDTLVKKLALKHEHLLLVTQQSAGLRQSFFLNGKLKFSRLTLAVDRDGAPVNVAGETAKTQQFLTSTRLIDRGNVLHTVIVAPPEQIARLEPLCQNGLETAYHFLPMRAAAAACGQPDTPALADRLLLHVLGKLLPTSHYTLGDARRFYQLWRARLAMFGAAIAICTVSLAWVGSNLWHYVDDSSRAEHLSAEADQFDTRYRAALSNMPPAVARTANMKAAVTIEQMMQKQAPAPQDMLMMLGSALDRAPQIRIVQLDWRVTPPGVKAPVNANPNQMGTAQASGTPGTATPLSSLLLGIPRKPAQSLHVEAEVDTAEDNYRSIVDGMNQFTQELARRPNLIVEIEQPPFDTRSSAKLSGKAGASASGNKSKFTLNLVWNP
ncbi:hypothetical protein HSX11_16910 [Oxalobacteraceae bacterium]|nr:hypothetical protein [Oxalobacteraceae bacterium]